MNRELALIQELMEELRHKMRPDQSDYDRRLGKKPEVEVIKMEGKMPMGKSDEDMPEGEMKNIEDILPHKMGMDDEDGDEFDFEEPSEKSMMMKRLKKMRR